MKLQSNKKVQMASTFLGLVLLGAFIANQQSLGHLEDEVKPDSRAPASQGSLTMASLARQKVDENKLAEQVAKPHSRGIASIGAAANNLESLRFGILEGKYDFKMNGDYISEITLPDGHTEKPAIVQDRAEFLNNFREQFGAVSAPEKVSSVLKDDYLIETYRVKTKSAKDRIIQLTIGESNTLLNLKTGEAPTLKLF